MVLISSERRLYDFLRQSADHQGYPPSIREMKVALQASSTSFVQDLLDRLQQKGYIVRRRGQARSIAVQCSELPLKGMIQAGFFVDHPEGCDRIRLDGQRYQPDDYALRVIGDSMEEAGILAGDIVVIRPTSDLWAIQPGHIGVVWIDGEGTTLKRIFYKEDDPTFTLKAANPNYGDRTLERPRVGVQGVMVGHHRLTDSLWTPVAKEE